MTFKPFTWCALALLLTTAGTLRGAEEEFNGPFPSWRNLKSDYGAAGDGQADDSGSLQRALTELTKHTNHCVLYVPAGTYRVTRTLATLRQAHTDMQSVALVGEDPALTVIRYDGTNSGVLLHWDAWYSKLSRLTLDGAGKASTALHVGDHFSTYNETSDMIFRDAPTGIQFGDSRHDGQAENAVLRCQFLRCTNAGIVTENFNSMDIWVWHSRFEDCGHALFNRAGNFHAWHNLFLRSRVADIGTQNLMVFSFVGNTSIGSHRFLDFESGHTWGAPTTIAANRILNPTADIPLRLGNAGPYLVMDNVFRMPEGSTNRAAQMTWADQTFVGNVYTVSNAVSERGRFRRVAERVVAPSSIGSEMAELPSTPAKRARRIVELPANADAEAIQRAFDEAVKFTGQRPVVHLPMGTSRITKTLTIAAGSDLQFVGDSAGEGGSRLDWVGEPGGALLRVEGPTKVTLRDLHLHAPKGRSLMLKNVDQPGGRIFADELNVSGPSNGGTGLGPAALRVTGMDRTRVQLRCSQGSGNDIGWVSVEGGPGASEAQPVEILCGASSSAVGQYSVTKGGKLVVRSVYHEKSADSVQGILLEDSGMLSIDATRFSYKTSATAPLFHFRNFRGLFTVATGLLLPVDSTNTCRFEMDGSGAKADVLSLNNCFWVEEPGVTAATVWLNRAVPPAIGGLVGCNVNASKKGLTSKGFAFLQNIGPSPDPAKSSYGSGPLENQGTVTDEVLLWHLASMRGATGELPQSPTPAQATDFSIHRVMANGIVEFSGSSPSSR